MGVGASYSRRALGRWRQLTCPPGGRRAERELSPLSLSRASSTTSWKSSTGSTPIAVIGVPRPRAPAAACLAADVVNRCRGWITDLDPCRSRSTAESKLCHRPAMRAAVALFLLVFLLPAAASAGAVEKSPGEEAQFQRWLAHHLSETLT